MAKESKSVDSKDISVDKDSDFDSSSEKTTNDSKTELDKVVSYINLLQ